MFSVIWKLFPQIKNIWLKTFITQPSRLNADLHVVHFLAHATYKPGDSLKGDSCFCPLFVNRKVSPEVNININIFKQYTAKLQNMQIQDIFIFLSILISQLIEQFWLCNISVVAEKKKYALSKKTLRSRI